MESQESKDKRINIYLSMLLPLGIAAFAWAVWHFPVHRVDVSLIVLSVVTVFFSSYLRIQLPRTKIHLTVSDGLIFLSLLIFGGEVAILLAVLEATFTSLNFRRQGIVIKLKTVAINILIAAIAAFGTAFVVGAAFGTPDEIMAGFGTTPFFWALTVMALTQFLVNSAVVSAVVAIKSDSTLWKVWNESCLNALVMYVIGGALAGVLAWAFTNINVGLIAATSAFFALVYLTYRRYADDVKATAALAEESERNRANQAEKHILELEHYVGQLEKRSEELRLSRESFRHAAFHNVLTGLPNRNYFMEALEKLLASESDPESKFAVLFLDLNRFRTINDSMGHSIGDQLIQDVAKRLSTMTAEGDIVGHFGGDEFAFILTKDPGQATATAFADRVARRIAESFRFNDRQVFTTVSVGIAFGDRDCKRAEDVLRDADIAMYYAKDNEENYVIFDKTMHTRAVSLQQLETDLRYAIVRNELELFYQPIVELNSATLSGFEALVRWNHPTRGLVAPSEFISVSEDSGLVVPMTLQILRTACGQMVEWQNRSGDNRELSISVNLSGKHFSQPDLVGQVVAILDETKLDPCRLKLEITESVVMANAEKAIAMLEQIRDIGVRLSVDDFGTGYSSLSYLHRFPIDTLKIDRSFVNMMDKGGDRGEIVNTIVALAAALKLNVIAEGIETVEQLDQLNALGCEYGQGYLFSRPLPVSEIDKMLQDKTRWKDLLLETRHALSPGKFNYPAFEASHTR